MTAMRNWLGALALAVLTMDGMATGGVAMAQMDAPGVDPAAIARRYRERAQQDADQAQTWTACSAAAARRGTASGGDADAYGAKMAEVLKLIVADRGRSPCPDAIPPSVWDRGVAATPVSVALPQGDLLSGETRAELERARRQEEGIDTDALDRAGVERLNREAAARTQTATAKIEADMAAGRIRREEYEAARQRYDADKARIDAETEAARQAQADYDRQMQAYDAQYGRKRR